MSEPADELGKAYSSTLDRVAASPDEDVRTTPLPDEGPVHSELASEPSGWSESPPAPIRILEALLFVGGSPLDAKRASEVIRGLTPEQFIEAIDSLNRDYRRQGRPYVIQPRDAGYVLTLKPTFHGVIERVYGGPKEARLSTTAVDTLALVAYRQPATKAEIDGLRGADSGALLRQLVRRGLVEVVYRADAQDREVSYGTTKRFLELFGLESLDDLPRTQDLQQI